MTDTAPADTTQDTPPVGDVQPAPADTQDTPKDDVAVLQEKLKKANAEAAKSRVNAKQAAAEEARNEIAQQIGKALGLVQDGDAAPDPAKLASQVGDLTGENRELKVELAVWRNAAKVGANAQSLTDSRSFMAKLGKLDPAADNFDGKLSDLVKKTLDENPQYRASGQAPASRGGTEPTGRPGGAAPTNLTDAITARIASQGGT